MTVKLKSSVWVIGEKVLAIDINDTFARVDTTSPFGSGIDGAYVFSNQGTAPAGTTKTDNTAGATIFRLDRDVFCTDLTINSTVTLLPNGYRIFCTGTFTNNGSIKADATNGAIGGNADAGFSNGGGGGGTGTTPAGTIAGGSGGSGGSGSTVPAGNPSQSFTNTPVLLNTAGVVGGSASYGGVGGTTSNSLETLTWTQLPLTASTLISSTEVTYTETQWKLGLSGSLSGILLSIIGKSTGGGGGGANYGATVNGQNVTGAGGGGAGGTGGLIYISARVFVNGVGGVIQSIGGNGGNGGSCAPAAFGQQGGGGGGSGGNGGVLLIIYQTYTQSGTYTFTGGTGGTGGNGSNGASAVGNIGNNGLSGNVGNHFRVKIA